MGMIPAVESLIVTEGIEMPGQKRGFVRLYQEYLIQYLDAIDAELATIRQQMNVVALAGRVPYPFSDLIERERAERRGEDPRNYAQIVASAIIKLDHDLLNITDWQAIQLYIDMPKVDSRFAETERGVTRVRVHEDLFPLTDRITSYLMQHDFKVERLREGAGVQIVANLAVIYAGRLLMRS